MGTTNLRRARIEHSVVVSTVAGSTEVLSPGEYYVEDVGLSFKLHPDADREQVSAELGAATFDAMLTRHHLVFLSWH